MPDTCTRHPDATLIGPACADCACPGFCNRRPIKAWADYERAVEQHTINMDFHHLAYGEYLAELDAWHAPLALPAEPQHPNPPTEPTTPIAHGNPVWCGRCPPAIDNALTHIDDLAALLAASIDGHRGGHATGPNGYAAPDHKTIVETLDDLYRELGRVEDQWREHRGYDPRPRRAVGAHARTLTISWLRGQLGDILLHPGSRDFGVGVLRWESRLLKLTKSDPVSKASPIRCPRCSERQVSRRDDGYFECLCGRLLNQTEYDREYSSQADEHDRQEAHA